MVKGLRTHAVWAAAALLAAGGCTVKDQSVPPLSGPSETALSLQVTATPDSLTQDGASQASIQVYARDANAQPIRGLSVRLDMQVNGAVQDYGTLSAKTIVTGNDGKAFSVYTAPPPLPDGSVVPTCKSNLLSPGVSGQCVDIVATPTSSSGTTPPGNFTNEPAVATTVRLVPPGTILPGGVTPYVTFSYSPNPVNMGVPVTFDASLSCWTALQGGVCPPPGVNGGSISSYTWALGDGTTATGMTVNHTYSQQQTYNVTLTVTNNFGIKASTTQTIAAGTVTAPKADFVFSPAAPTISDTIVFNADTSTAATGHQITTFNWDFGDGSQGSGYTTSHKYANAGSYNVVLSVLDDTGQKATTTKAVAVVVGNPVPVISYSPTAGNHPLTISFSAASTQLFGGATISSYAWDFGDPTSGSNSSNQATPTHQYQNAGSYLVSVTITDNKGRTGYASVTVTVQ